MQEVPRYPGGCSRTPAWLIEQPVGSGSGDPLVPLPSPECLPGRPERGSPVGEGLRMLRIGPELQCCGAFLGVAALHTVGLPPKARSAAELLGGAADMRLPGRGGASSSGVPARQAQLRREGRFVPPLSAGGGAREAAAAMAGGLLLLLALVVSSESFEPNCTTDFATELVCHWSMNATINCTHKVQLLYAQQQSSHRNDNASLPSVCIPENKQGSDSTPQCTCSIQGKKFQETWFFLELEVNGTKIGQRVTLNMDDHVKPRPLVNLTADTRKNHLVVLTWAWDAVYTQESDLHLGIPSYEVVYWPEGQREKSDTKKTERESYEISVERLSPGPYLASVRFQTKYFWTYWSDWSTPCKFYVESRNRSQDKLWLLVLWLCVVIMAAILTFYLCFTRLKSWWDGIPNPAKSKVTEDMTQKPLSATRKMYAVWEGKAPLYDRQGRDYANIPDSFGAAALPGPATRQQILEHGSAGARLEAFLTPEVTLVESSLMICSHDSADKAKDPEREALADTAPPHEDAMASLFLKILDCEFSMAEEDLGGPTDEAPASEQASCHLLNTLSFLPETLGSEEARKESPDSKCSYQSSLVEGSASCGASPPPEHQHSSSVLSLPKDSPCLPTNAVGPLAPQQGKGSAAATAHLSGYRCLGSLLSQSTTGSSQGWEPQLFPPEADKGQPWASDSGGCRLESVFPQNSPWFLSCEATRALDFQLQQEAGPGATYQNIPWKPGAASCLATSLPSGYQSFSSALQNGTASTQQDHGCLDLASPYKPFLSIFRNSPPEAPVCGVLLEPGPGGQR